MAQARCYGYIYGLQEALDEVTLQLTYCNLETEEIRRFQEIQTMDELSEWFAGLIHEYVKWATAFFSASSEVIPSERLSAIWHTIWS